jgi:hypothetical protein
MHTDKEPKFFCGLAAAIPLGLAFWLLLLLFLL